MGYEAIQGWYLTEEAVNMLEGEAAIQRSLNKLHREFTETSVSSAQASVNS